LQIISYSLEDGIILEYMPNGNLRNYLRSQAVKINREQRLQWVCDVAEGLHLLHSYNIIHYDIKPENLLLDSRLRLRIIDFSGSSIDGAWASAFEGVRFYLPRPWESPSTVQTDLFALGSTIYEIMTGAQPYEELTDEEVVALFEEQKFPLVDNLPCGGVIKRCWHGEFDSAEEVHGSIKAEIQKYRVSFFPLANSEVTK
jgi:serine/threonine protein kinase